MKMYEKIPKFAIANFCFKISCLLELILRHKQHTPAVTFALHFVTVSLVLANNFNVTVIIMETV